MQHARYILVLGALLALCIPQASADQTAAVQQVLDGLQLPYNPAASVCTYTGITCTAGLVTSIQLHLPNTTTATQRTLHPAISQLANLTHFNLSRSQIHGAVPPLPVGLLSLDLSHNALTSLSTTHLRSLLALRHLDLSHNQLVVDINWPPTNETSTSGAGQHMFFDGMYALAYLDLSHNRIFGNLRSIRIESFIANAQLHTLNLAQNSLRDFADLVSNLPNLRTLNISRNSLSGTFFLEVRAASLLVLDVSQNRQILANINEVLLAVPNLQELHAAGTSFTGLLGVPFVHPIQVIDLEDADLGAVHPSIANMPNLRVLDLSANDAEGSIPSELTSLSKLELLHLDQNRFQGAFPPISNFPVLRNIHIGFNAFSSDINTVLVSPLSTQLQHINMSFNFFQGTFPKQLLDLPNLSVLFLGFNQLVGPLPQGPVKAPLRLVDLQSNQFTGSVPHALATVPTLNTVFLANNLLSGALPQGMFVRPESTENLQLEYRFDLSFNRLTVNPLPQIAESNIGRLSVRLRGNPFAPISIPDTPDWATDFTCINLDLGNTRLVGSVPASLAAAHMAVLDLSENRLEGVFPWASLRRPSSRAGIDASSCTLLSLVLSHNEHLEVPLQTTIHPFYGLVELRLDNVDLSKQTFETLWQQMDTQALRNISVAFSRIAGEVPQQLFRTDLLYADLSSSYLTVNIPTSNCSNSLAELNLLGTVMQGVVPFDQLSRSLESLVISPSLGSTITAEIPSFPRSGNPFLRLHTLRLTNIRTATGGMQFSFCSLFPNLRELDLSRTRINSPLSPCLSTLRFLQRLIVPDTGIYGCLPPLATTDLIQSLTAIDVSSNRLNCSTDELMSRLTRRQFAISDFVVRSPALQVFEVSDNQLHGNVAPLLQPLNWLQVVAANNPDINGELPSLPQSADYAKISLQGCRKITGDIPRSMRLLASLQQLDLRDTQVQHSGIPANMIESRQRIRTQANSLGGNQVKATDVFVDCPLLKGVSNLLELQYSPSLTNYTNCICSDGFFGFRNVCLPCPTYHPRCKCSNGTISGCRVVLRQANQTELDPHKDRIELCPMLNEACPETAQNNTALQVSCGEPYRDNSRLCSSCRRGFFRHGLVCSECGSFFSDGWLFLVLIPLLLVTICYVLAKRMFAPGSKKGTMKILLFALQAMGILKSSPISLFALNTSRVAEPIKEFCKGMLDASTSVANLSPNSLQCMLDHGHGEPWLTVFLINTLTPIAVIVLLCFVIYALAYRYAKHLVDTTQRLRQYVLGFLLYLLTQFAYAGITLHSLNKVGCSDIEDHATYLVTLPFVQCAGDGVGQDYQTALSVALILIVVVSIGVPIAAGYVLYRIKRDDLLDDEATINAYGHLFCSYRKEVWFYELVLLARRALLSLIVSFVPFANYTLFATLTSLVLTGSLWLHLVVKPFKRDRDNRLEQVSLGMLLTTFLSGCILSLNAQHDDFIVPVIAIVSFVLIIVVLMGLFATHVYEVARVFQEGVRKHITRPAKRGSIDTDNHTFPERPARSVSLDVPLLQQDFAAR